MITLSSLPLASGKQADLTPSDICALLSAYITAANGGSGVGTDAVTLAFARGLFAYISNRFGVMAEISQSIATTYANPNSPDSVAQIDEYGNPSAELVNNGKAATSTV